MLDKNMFFCILVKSSSSLGPQHAAVWDQKGAFVLNLESSCLQIIGFVELPLSGQDRDIGNSNPQGQRDFESCTLWLPQVLNQVKSQQCNRVRGWVHTSEGAPTEAEVAIEQSVH